MLPSVVVYSILIAIISIIPSSNAVALRFREAPKFYNSQSCPNANAINVAMILDAAYLRGSIAAIFSVLQHSSCPENILFHFVASSSADTTHLGATISASFPYLHFQIYPFNDSAAAALISTSIRAALDCPLNYARNYLADLLPVSIAKIVYLDSDLVLVDDIAKLAATPQSSPHRTTGAHAVSEPIVDRFEDDKVSKGRECMKVHEDVSTCDVESKITTGNEQPVHEVPSKQRDHKLSWKEVLMNG